MSTARTFRSVRFLAVLGLGLVTASCSGDSVPVGPGPDLPDPGETVIPGQALVRLLQGGSIGSVNARHGTRTLEAIEEERVYLLGLPEGSKVEEVVAELRTDPEVSSASPNGQVGIPEAQGRSTMAFADPSLEVADYTDQQAIARIRATDVWGETRGAGVIVAVLDTGVDATHPQLQGRIAPGGFDVIGGDNDPSDVPDGVDNDGDRLIDEALGHGTFVAGLILSVAPEATILPIRVLNSDGVGSAVGIARGIQLAVEGGARVINLSLGMSVEADVVEEIIEDMVDGEGVVFVASAGNQSVSSPGQFPAREDEVIGVAATDVDDRRADFSNFGSWVDVAAPGVGLVSLFPGGGLANWSGTSFSAALTSGEAALLVSVAQGDADDVQEDVQAVIRASALRLTDPTLNGIGRIDVLAALRVLLGGGDIDDAGVDEDDGSESGSGGPATEDGSSGSGGEDGNSASSGGSEDGGSSSSGGSEDGGSSSNGGGAEDGTSSSGGGSESTGAEGEEDGNSGGDGNSQAGGV